MQVMYDVLSLMEGRNEGLNRTAIMYRANLSHDMLKKYLGEALSFGFIMSQANKFLLTAKGDIFLYKMRDIAGLFAMPMEEKDGGAIAILH